MKKVKVEITKKIQHKGVTFFNRGDIVEGTEILSDGSLMVGKSVNNDWVIGKQFFKIIE